jgi:hypothetical protein
LPPLGEPNEATQTEVLEVKTNGFIAVIALALVALSTTVAGAAQRETAGAAAREFEGTVVSKNSDAKTFRLRDVERGTVTIKVNRNTRFERINGFAGLKVGAKNIESTVKRSNGAWLALEVERSGGGGEHGGRDDDCGGDNDRGDDDRRGDDDDRGGDDDRTGDDHGGHGGHGGDDH